MKIPFVRAVEVTRSGRKHVIMTSKPALYINVVALDHVGIMSARVFHDGRDIPGIVFREDNITWFVHRADFDKAAVLIGE